MLVLSRKSGEELIIGDNIRVVVNKIAGNRVSLAIRAPKDVRVVRGELDAVEPPQDPTREANSITVPAFDYTTFELPRAPR